MAHIQVTISGRQYRMACGEGEEKHLEALAASFDGKIGEMRAAFGEIGDMRLHVMAALTLSDELLEMRNRVATLEAEVGALRQVAAAEAARLEDSERRVADALNKTADRIERLTRSHGSTSAGG
jgi:cell division protein ZapA